MNMFKAGTVSQVLAKMGTKQQAAKTKKNNNRRNRSHTGSPVH